MFGSYSKLPGGNVHPARFVKLGTDDTVTEAGSGDPPFGISQPYTWKHGILDDGLAGTSTSPPINIFGPGDDQAMLELGGTVTEGQFVKAGSAGVGVAATADKDRVGALAMRSGVSGDLIPVKPLRFDNSI